jgi:two-component system osmolarity sensor histidine kinase EnvZ
MTGSVGLGLSLAETIVSAHNGKLTLDSSDSGGLLVTVTLPRANPPAS